MKASVTSGLVLALAAVVARVRTGGYHLLEGRVPVALAPWELVLVQHLARRIAAADRPGDLSIPTPDEVDVAGFVDRFCEGMAPRMRRDLGRFFLYLEHLAPLRLGLGARFTDLPPADQDRVLARTEAADEGLLRGGFEGVKALVFMGYYRDARTWRIVGYEGPALGRPT